MVYRLRFYNLLMIISLFFGMKFLLFADSGQNAEHGWGRIDQVRVNCGEVLFYRQPLGLLASLPEGSVIRIKALKTGTGNYYHVVKDNNGVWILRADPGVTNDPTAQFLVSHSGSAGCITLSSEAAGDLLLASDPKTFNVNLVSDKAATPNSTLWKLVEDSNAGDTLEQCFLQNVASGGTLTASYAGGGTDAGDVIDLQKQITQAQQNTPYLQITYARSGGTFHNNDIADALNKQISDDGVLKLTGNWIERISGCNSWAAGTGSPSINGRTATVRFIVNGDKTKETEVKVREKGNQPLIISPYEGKFAQQLAAEYANNPLTALRKTLASIQNKAAAAGKLDLTKSLIARTGFIAGSDSFPFETGQSSKVAIEKVVDLGGDDDAGAEKETIAAGSSRVFTDPILWAHNRPEFKGSAELDLPNFVSGTVVSVTSQAIAWLSESLTTPGRGTISFRAMADQSDITVCLSDSISQFPVYRIVYGAAANTKTIIYKNDVPVQEISNEQNENAHIAPGVLQTFWVSLNNGFIIVGTGDPGSIILMAWQDSSPAQGIERVGLGAGKTKVKYTDVEKLDVPIITVAPQIAYVKDSNPIQVGTNKAPAWYSLPLSPADAGTVVFQANGSQPANLVLSDDQGEGYIISFGADGNTSTKIIDLKGGGELYGVYSTIDAMTRPTEISASLPTSVQPTAVQPTAGTAVASAVGPSMTVVHAVVGPSAAGTPTATAPASLVPSIKTAVLSSLAILDTNKPNKFWVCYYKGRIILGKGDVGKNPFCIYVDVGAPKGISKIGFSGKATISNLELWPELDLNFEPPASEYVKQAEFSPFSGSLAVISPFYYAINQQGPEVVFTDRLTGMMWNVGATADPGAAFHFTLDIDKTGVPNLKLLFPDPSAQTIALQATVTMASGQEDASMRISQAMAGGAGGMMPSTNILALALSGVAGAAGAGWAAGQADASSKLNELQQLANRYIYTEQVGQDLKGSAQIQAEAAANRQSIEQTYQPTITQLQLQDAAQLDNATKQWAIVLGLITDGYVVQNQSTKSWILRGLTEAYNAVKSLDLTTVSLPIYNRMVKCLIMAYNNAYLTKAGDATDEAQKADWYLWLNNLSNTLFSSPALMAMGIDVDGFKGEYLWFPTPFAQPGQGSVVFEAKAFSNIFVAFSDNPLKVRNVSNRMYEFVIGMWDNKTFSTHRKSLGDEVYGFNLSDKPDMTPDPSTFKKYWINIANGKISGGVGELGQNKLWEWQDPYPASPVKWVGFSNWLTVNTFRNVKVGYPFVEGAGFTPAAQPRATAPVVTTAVTSDATAAAQTAAPTVDTSVGPAVDTSAAPVDTSAAAPADTSAAPVTDTSAAAPSDDTSADASVADTSAADASAAPAA